MLPPLGSEVTGMVTNIGASSPWSLRSHGSEESVGVRSSVPVVKLTKRERTAGPMLVDFFKKPKRSGVG